MITILQRIHANKLFIGLQNSQDRSFEAETKTAKFRSRDQDCGFVDYISDDIS